MNQTRALQAGRSGCCRGVATAQSGWNVSSPCLIPTAKPFRRIQDPEHGARNVLRCKYRLAPSHRIPSGCIVIMNMQSHAAGIHNLFILCPSGKGNAWQSIIALTV